MPPEWLDEDAPPREYVLTRDGQGFLPRGIVGMFVGPGGLSKSQLMIQLALDVAAGRRWLDTCDTGDGGNVFLGLAEEDECEIRRRIRSYFLGFASEDTTRSRILARLFPAPLVDLNSAKLALSFDELRTLYVSRGELAQRMHRREPFATPLYDALLAFLSAPGREWRLVILDPASQLGPSGFESDASAAARFIRMLQTIALLPGRPTVLLVHHTNKSSRTGSTDATAARGTSALTDCVRWQANVEALTPDDDPMDTSAGLIRLKVPKSNYTRPLRPMDLVRSQDGIVRLATEEELAALNPVEDRKGDSGNKQINLISKGGGKHKGVSGSTSLGELLDRA